MAGPARQRNLFEHFKDHPLLPELPVVGFDRHEASIATLRPHAHENVYEMCLIAAGAVQWWVGDEVHDVVAGQWFITRPGEAHGGVDSMMHRCELYFLQIALPDDGRVPGMELASAQALAKSFAALRRHRFAASPRALELMQALIQEYRSPGPHAALLARGALHQVLVQILRDHEAEEAQCQPSPAIAQAMHWMQQRLSDDFHVGDVADAVGLSVNHFQTRFRKEVGLTPADYRARQRVQRAQAMLRKPQIPITRVAMDLGFASSQYFATTFRRIVGMSPRAYRERWLKGYDHAEPPSDGTLPSAGSETELPPRRGKPRATPKH